MDGVRLPDGDPGDLIFAELSPDLECRSYLIGSASAREAVVVDPLLERVPQALGELQGLGLRLAFTFDTHTHADHLSGARELVRLAGGRTAGAPVGCVHQPLGEGDELQLGHLVLRVWATPGHTGDSLSLLLPDRVLSGDTLLIGTTGRTDLPGGSAEEEWWSLQRLLTLPDAALVFPGHDYSGKRSSTLGEERRENPRLLRGRERFLEAMAVPRASKPKLLDQALAYNRRPLDG